MEPDEEFRNILFSYRELLMADKIMARKFIIQTYEKTKKVIMYKNFCKRQKGSPVKYNRENFERKEPSAQ
ncbi:MAG: hypothetical protein QXW01_03510 [Candidatus Aenigmatarchaeota archaeon]